MRWSERGTNWGANVQKKVNREIQIDVLQCDWKGCGETVDPRRDDATGWSLTHPLAAVIRGLQGDPAAPPTTVMDGRHLCVKHTRELEQLLGGSLIASKPVQLVKP
jgi:hypothetical protein